MVVTEYERVFLKDFPLMGMELSAKPFPETHGVNPSTAAVIQGASILYLLQHSGKLTEGNRGP